MIEFDDIWQQAYTPFELFGNEVGKGWMPLVAPVLNRIQELNAAGAQIEIDQVKEKYGELCIYVAGAPPEISEMIREAEEQSRHICERCGKPGKRVFGPYFWIYTRCPECIAKERIKVLGIVKETHQW